MQRSCRGTKGKTSVHPGLLEQYLVSVGLCCELGFSTMVFTTAYLLIACSFICNV